MVDFVDLFCGAGLVSCGAKATGLRPILAIDWDRLALDSYCRNHPKVETVAMNLIGPGAAVAALAANGIGRKYRGVIWLSPPCQELSNARGDHPTTSIPEIYSLIAEVAAYAPHALLVIENVRGFMDDSYEEYRVRMGSKLISSRGYVVDDHYLSQYVVRAQDYGVPQNRERIIFPLPGKGKPAPGLPKQWLKVGITIAAAIGGRFKDPDDFRLPLVGSEHSIFCEIPEGGNWRDSRHGREMAIKKFKGNAPDWFLKRPKWSDLPPCVIASKRAWLKTANFVHPTETRRFTIGELRAFQTIPTNYYIAGNGQERIQQVGNAVPPRLVSALLQHFVKKCC